MPAFCDGRFFARRDSSATFDKTFFLFFFNFLIGTYFFTLKILGEHILSVKFEIFSPRQAERGKGHLNVSFEADAVKSTRLF